MKTLMTQKNGEFKMEIISAIVRWNEENSNKIGMTDTYDEEELISLVKDGLDPFEFITEEDIETYK
jgi:hypothetical protein